MLIVQRSFRLFGNNIHSQEDVDLPTVNRRVNEIPKYPGYASLTFVTGNMLQVMVEDCHGHVKMACMQSNDCKSFLLDCYWSM